MVDATTALSNAMGTFAPTISPQAVAKTAQTPTPVVPTVKSPAVPPPTSPSKERGVLSNANIDTGKISSSIDKAGNKGLRQDANGNTTYADGTAYNPPQTAGQGAQGVSMSRPAAEQLFKGDFTGVIVNQDGSVTASPEAMNRVTGGVATPKNTTDPNDPNYVLNPTSPSYDPLYFNKNPEQDPIYLKNVELLNNAKAESDASSKAMIDAIHQSYDSLIDIQKTANTASEASRATSLLLAGSSRYAQLSSEGIQHAQVSYGIQQITDLQAKMNTALAQAQSAKVSNDWKYAEKMIGLHDDLQKTQRETMQKIADNLQKIKDEKQKIALQVANDKSVLTIMHDKGLTNEQDILSELNKQGNTTVTAKDVHDTIANLSPNAKEIATGLSEMAKNGAPKEEIAVAGKSKTLAEFYQNAGKYLKDPTSNAAMYNSYVAKATSIGQVPISAEDFLAKNKQKESYAAEAGKQAADVKFGKTNAGQDKLEQEYRQVILKELSNRAGGLGLQDAKVNQAIHLNSLLNQYKTIDAKGNISYNIPQVQYVELAMGLANLVAPTGQVSDSARESILQKTAAGDIAGALSYITGTPKVASTQAVYKNLADSIDRQGRVSEDLRDTYVKTLHGLAPTDLEQKRIDALEKNTLASYRNPPVNVGDQIIKDEDAAKKSVIDFGTKNPDQQPYIKKILNTNNPKTNHPYSYSDAKQLLGIQ